MQYRHFARAGVDASVLGFGCMRLPQVTENGKSVIDRPEAIRMIRHAIDSGINYVDTAYPYHGGDSEVLVGEALSDGYRQKTLLATKMPVWLVEKHEDFYALLDTQLKRLRTDCLDFYLLHALDSERWPKMKALGVTDFLEEMVEKGKIRFPSFSFHDDLTTFKQIIDGYDNWYMHQVQINYLDEHYQAGVEGIAYAASKGIPCVAMEPLRGGRLAQNLPQEVVDVFAKADNTKSPVEWAFRWLYNFPEIKTILSGMSSMAQLEENLAIFNKDTSAHCMNNAEQETIAKAKEVFTRRIKIACTNCEYCMPCPSGVNIPRVFWFHNEASLFDTWEQAKKSYADLVKADTGADKCISCGLCEGMCPQSLPIIEALQAAAKELG